MLYNYFINRLIYPFLSKDDKRIYDTIIAEGIDVISGPNDVTVTLWNGKVVKCMEVSLNREGSILSYYMQVYPYASKEYESIESTSHQLSSRLYDMIYTLGLPAYVRQQQREKEAKKVKVESKVDKLVSIMREQ